MLSNMIKLKLILIIIPLMILFLTGCWDRHELNEMAIISAAGVDPHSEKELTFIYQIVNPSAFTDKGASSIKTPFFTLKTNSQTLFSAISMASRELLRTLYLGHLQAFIINSEFATEFGLRHLFDFLYRNNEIRENIHLFVTDDQSVEDILSTQFVLENINGLAIEKYLLNAYENEGVVRPVELREAVSILVSGSTCLVLPLIKISPPNPESNLTDTQTADDRTVITVEGFAVFKKDRQIGTLNPKEGRALNFVTDDINKTDLVFPYKGHNHTLEILNSDTKISTEIKNGKPEILIEIENRASLNDFTIPMELDNQTIINELEKISNKIIKEEVEAVISKTQQEFRVDIFQFGEKISKQHPKDWEKIKDDWEEYFVDLEVKIKVNTTITDIGMKINTFSEGIGEE